MTSIGSPSPFFFGGKKAYEIERSLRFNRDDNAYLTRTPSSAGNRKTFTFSAWVKLGQTGINTSNDPGNGLFLSCGAGSSGANMTLRITNNGYIGIDYYGIGGYYSSDRLRDSSAWYHCVWVMDTTESTAANRMKVYVNGNLFYNNQMGLSQNADTPLNNNSATTIGAYSYSTSHAYRLDAYLAEVHFLDGYAYDPSYFAETNAATGQWNPKEYTGNYGSNGFYLNFSDTSSLGADSSGNSNNFTPNNFSTSAGEGNDSVEDTPTNNWCTLNPLDPDAKTLSNGNLKCVGSTGFMAGSNFVVTSGKWYMEVKYVSGTSNHQWSIGFSSPDRSYKRQVRGGDGELTPNTGTVAVTFADPDVIMVALDVDNGKWYIGKNGSYMLSGDPVNGTGFVHSGLSSSEGFMLCMINNTGDGSQTIAANFGQQGFTYTPPTGFKALNSANLPDPTIKLPNEHFNTVLYTGNSSNGHAITGVGFQPDWTWIKARSDTRTHSLVDAVRGAGKIVSSNNNNAEYTDATAFASFDSNGFTVGTSENYINDSAHTYVGWNWNAGETDSKTYAVTVVDDSGNKYRFDGFGTSAVTLDLAEGGTYIFDQSHSSNATHPLRFYTAADKTGGEYTTGVTTAGTPGSSGAYTQIVVAASAPTLYYQCSAHANMGGQINTNSTLGSSNFDGGIQSTVKVNATAGFSITAYPGNGSNAQTVGHGLGVAPDVIILKSRTASSNWRVWHHKLAADGSKRLILDSTNASENASFLNDTAPTSTVFTLGNSDNAWNASGGTYITYLFSEVAGYSKFGSYVGNGSSSDGVFVFLGFKPALVIYKKYSNSDSWELHDNTRDTFNPVDKSLFPNTSAPESASRNVDFLSNGFKHRNANGNTNENGENYIYLAFAESPFKNARAR